MKILVVVCIVFLTGCSSLSFTRADRPFDGTVHATSSLICSGYWSNHNDDGSDMGRSFIERIVPTLGLALYSSVDLVTSVVGDIIVFPIHAGGGGPSVASFDNKPHAIIPCGRISHSINTVGAM